jgi:hypothetical protein
MLRGCASAHCGAIARDLLAFVFARTGNAVFTGHPHSIASRMGFGHLDDLFAPTSSDTTRRST